MWHVYFLFTLIFLRLAYVEISWAYMKSFSDSHRWRPAPPEEPAIFITGTHFIQLSGLPMGITHSSETEPVRLFRREWTFYSLGNGAHINTEKKDNILPKDERKIQFDEPRYLYQSILRNMIGKSNMFNGCRNVFSQVPYQSLESMYCKWLAIKILH